MSKRTVNPAGGPKIVDTTPGHHKPGKYPPPFTPYWQVIWRKEKKES